MHATYMRSHTCWRQWYHAPDVCNVDDVRMRPRRQSYALHNNIESTLEDDTGHTSYSRHSGSVRADIGGSLNISTMLSSYRCLGSHDHNDSIAPLQVDLITSREPDTRIIVALGRCIQMSCLIRKSALCVTCRVSSDAVGDSSFGIRPESESEVGMPVAREHVVSRQMAI